MAPGGTITKGSALLTPEGVFNGAIIPNYTNNRKRDTPEIQAPPFQIEGEMGRQQGRSTLNNIKSNRIPPETSGSTTARPEHPNTDEAEENNLKNNFMKMVEEIKDSLKEAEE